MDFGVVLTLQNDAHRDLPTVYRDALEDVVLAEELGFSAALVGEHHGAEDDFCPAPLTVAAALAARTRSIRVGTGVALLPLHDPVAFAEHAAVVDVLSGGRLILGVAAGYRPRDFDVRGVPRQGRGARTDQVLEAVLRLWGNGTVRPGPWQRPRPELWVDATTVHGARRAARFDAVPLFATGPVPLIAAQIAAYEMACTAAGRTPSRRRALVRELHVAPTRAEAFEACHTTLFRTYREDYISLGGVLDVEEDGVTPRLIRDPDDPAMAPDVLARDRMLVGDPDDVATGVDRYRRDLGVTDLVFVVHHRGLSPPAVRQSLRLFARSVLPVG